MQLTHWLNDLAGMFRPARCNPARSRRRTRREPMVAEVLEDRTLLSALTVNTTDDNTESDAVLTLREAILLVNNAGDANAALGRSLSPSEQAQIDTTEPFGTNDTISFDSAFSGGTVLLQSQSGGPELFFSASVQLVGPGSSLLTIDAQRNSRIATVATAGDFTVELRGVTLTGGMVGNAENGGAIDNGGQTLILDDVNFSNNSAERGGAIYTQGGVLNLNNVQFNNNAASADGGGIYNDGGTITITNSSFTNNTATGDAGAIYNAGNSVVNAQQIAFDSNTAGDDGGAIFNEGTFDFTDGNFIGNMAVSFGGAVYNNTNAVTLNNIIVSNNDAAFGGGIATQVGGTTTIVSSTISGNDAGEGGGVFTENGGNTLVTDSTISNNTAINSGAGVANDGIITIMRSVIVNNASSGNGGGISNLTGTSNIINTTISGNSANEFGGGIFNGEDNVVVINSTIVLNTADADDNGGVEGGGIYTDTPVTPGIANTAIFNTLVAGNEQGSLSPFPSDVEGQSVDSASGSNLIGDPSTAAGLTHGTNGNIVGQDGGGGPRTVLPVQNVIDTTLADNGGPTFTHALVIDGPAFNTGNNAFATTPGDDGQPGTDDANEFPLITEQRGADDNDVVFRRIEFGTVDIGAFEIQAAVLNVAANTISMFEGDSGTTNFTFTLTRTGNLDGIATVDYFVSAPPLSGNTLDGTDFGGTFPSGMITFADQEVTQTLTIPVSGDLLPESDEAFIVNLQNPSTNAEIGLGDASSTILNDDDLSDFPNVSVNDAFAVEDGGTATVTISLSQAVNSDVSVDYVVEVGSADANDFTPTSGTATIPSGATSVTFNVAIAPDTDVEPDEQFRISLSNLVVAGSDTVFLNDAEGVGVILNDDVATGVASVQPRPVAPAAINGDTFQEVGSGNFDNIISTDFSAGNPSFAPSLLVTPEMAGSGGTPGAAADDLFFWDPRTGQNRIVFGDGTIQDDPFPRTAINGNDFTVVVFGNFDQGGGSDLFFWNPLTGRNRIMHASGTTGNVTGTIETNIVPEIAINGNEYTTFVSGDLDGGGAEDIYFWNPLTGENRLIHFETVINGSTTNGDNFQTSVIDPLFINGNDFEQLHLGQFTPAGLPEFLFINLGSGANRLVPLLADMAGESTMTGEVQTNMLPPTSFNGNDFEQIEIGDFNGDGVDDIFAFDMTSGQNRMSVTSPIMMMEPMIVEDVVPRGAINNGFSKVSRLTDQAFAPGDQDKLFFWDPLTGENRAAFL